MDLKKKCPRAKGEREYRVPRTPPDPVWVRETCAPPAAFPADGKWYEASGRRGDVPAWPAAVHECDKITALVMERGRKAFEAIIDNQNSTEPREGEEIESNGEAGEGGSWRRVFSLFKGKKRKVGVVYLLIYT